VIGSASPPYALVAFSRLQGASEDSQWVAGFWGTVRSVDIDQNVGAHRCVLLSGHRQWSGQEGPEGIGTLEDPALTLDAVMRGPTADFNDQRDY